MVDNDTGVGISASQPKGADSKQNGKQSRAGRNLPVAIVVGGLLAAMLITVLLVQPLLWLVVLAVAAPIATHEVARRLREAGYDVPFIPLLLGGQAMLWLSWPYGVTGVLGAFGGTVVLCMVWRLVDQGLTHTPVNYLRDMSATVLIAAWVVGEAVGGAAVRHLAWGSGMRSALVRAVRSVVRPSGLLVLVATNVVLAAVLVLATGALDVAFARARFVLLDDGVSMTAWVAMALLAAAWLATIVIVALATAWRSVAWTADMRRHAERNSEPSTAPSAARP